jgi:Putative auto-transporter adhesin, head GIN domain
MGKSGSIVKLPVFALMLALSTPAMAADRGYSVSDFDRIRVIGPFVVDVETGKGASAHASGTPQALDRVSVEIQGRQLTIKANRSAWGGWPGTPTAAARLKVTVPMLSVAALGGSGSLTISGMRGAKLSLAMEGSGTLVVKRVEADRLDASVAGAGIVTVAGTVKNLFLSGSGASTFAGEGLTGNDVQLTWQSAGNATLGALRTAKIGSTGSGLVTVVGKPACTVNAIGAGEVVCGKQSDQ